MDCSEASQTDPRADKILASNPCSHGLQAVATSRNIFSRCKGMHRLGGSDMDATQLAQFKILLLREKQKILNQSKASRENELTISADDLADEVDLATTETQQNLIFQMRDRERQMLHQIDSALQRIDLGTYGICEETEEPIELERLKLMPWTRLSAAGAEIREGKRKRFVG
ncbi:TraR/DksA family transcriptional regulator [bacterium]|nr:TraR/DksA family transcriptional regulator [bacterium]